MKIKFFLGVFSCALLLLILPEGVFAASGSLYFASSSLSIDKNSQQSVDVYESSGDDQIVGVDLILKFDPGVFTIIDITNSGAFSSLLKKSIDNSAGVSKVAFSNSFGTYTTGTNLMAKITLKAKDVDKSANLIFDFTKGVTTDSNIVTKDSKDILTSVVNLDVFVGNTQPNPTPTLSATPTPKQNPGIVKAIENVLGKHTPSSDNKGKGLIEKAKDLIDRLTGKKGSVLGTDTQNLSDPVKLSYKWYIIVIVTVLTIGGSFYLFALFKMISSKRKKKKV